MILVFKITGFVLLCSYLRLILEQGSVFQRCGNETFTKAHPRSCVSAVLWDGECGCTHRVFWIIAPIRSQRLCAQNKALQEDKGRLPWLPSGNIFRAPVNRIHFLLYGGRKHADCEAIGVTVREMLDFLLRKGEQQKTIRSNNQWQESPFN